MSRILFLPWTVVLREGQAPLDGRQSVYARQVPRYLSLRLDEVEGLEAQFVPYCVNSDDGPVFVVSGNRQSAEELRDLGVNYEVDVVISGQAEFDDTAQITLQMLQVKSGQEIERTFLGSLHDCQLFFESLLHILLRELQPQTPAPQLLTCRELSTQWKALSAFFCAVDRLLVLEIRNAEEDPQAVFDLFMEALEHDPGWEDGAEQLIGAALDYGLGEERPKIELAIEALERLVEKRCDLHKAWEALGHLYYQLKQFTKAVVCLESAQRFDPRRFASHHRLGSAYREVGRFPEAEIMLRTGLKNDPENIPLLNEMGVVLGECERLAEAAAFFQKAVELSPISGAFYANLAMALQRSGMLIEAEEAFQSGMRAVDSHWNVYVNYAQLLKEQERHLDWVRVLFQGMQALVDEPTERIDLATRLVDGVRNWIGQESPVEIKAKGTGWIIGLLESLVELLPEHQSGWVVLSEYYRQEGRHDHAIDCLTRVEGSDPENVWLKVHIGSILAGLGRHDEAIHRFENALLIEENNQVALANLIMIFAIQDRYEQALGLLDRYRQTAFGDQQFTDWKQIAEHIAKGKTT